MKPRICETRLCEAVKLQGCGPDAEKSRESGREKGGKRIETETEEEAENEDRQQRI